MATEVRNEERLESPQVNTGYVLLCALGGLAILGGTIAMVGTVYYRQVRVQSFPTPQQFPQPRVQTGQRAQLRELQKQQSSRLHAYRWVDQKDGLIEIPIDRAMQILASQGTQAYAPLTPAQALSTPSAGAERLQTPRTGAPPASPPTPMGGKQ